MKPVVFIVSVLLASGAVLGSTILLVSVGPPVAEWTLVPALVGLMIVIFGPFTLGSLLATWDFRRDDESRRLLRNWAVGIGVFEIAAVATIVFYAVVNGTPAWLPVLFGTACVVLTVVAVAVGPALLRRDLATRQDRPEWTPLSRLDIRRKVMRITVTFGAVFILGSIAALVLITSFGDPSEDIGFALLAVLASSFLASGLASMIVSFPLNSELRETTDHDAALLRRVGKAVLNRKPSELDASEMPAATHYAHVTSVLLPFQLAFFGQLYAGLMIQQAMQLTTRGGLLPLVLLLGLAAVFIAIAPLLIIRIRRARRWVREHADLTATAPGDVTANRRALSEDRPDDITAETGRTDSVDG